MMPRQLSYKADLGSRKDSYTNNITYLKTNELPENKKKKMRCLFLLFPSHKLKAR